MAKYISLDTVTNFMGRPLRAPRLTDDGEVQFSDPDRTPILKDADTLDLLRVVMFNIPKEIQAPNDGAYAPRLWQAITASHNGTIELDDKLYSWLHRVLKRELIVMPDGTVRAPHKDAREHGGVQMTYAARLWQMNDRAIVEQLKDLDERRPLTELTLEGGD